MNDHDPQIERGYRRNAWGGIVAYLIVLVFAWCVIVLMIAATWRLWDWIAP